MKLVVSLVLFLLSLSVFADPQSVKSIPTAKEFLNSSLESTFPIIEKLTKEETKELITQLRKEVKEEFPRADHFYFLISHLEEIQAVEKEQARLRSLLWVYSLAFVLFFGFMGFLLLRQRKAIRDINLLLEK
ncbi:hypothetical protein P3G55_01115 [Leptospira sp. 96542]|nr:hypothetical protein [Leptospira sp. 96542]